MYTYFVFSSGLISVFSSLNLASAEGADRVYTGQDVEGTVHQSQCTGCCLGHIEVVSISFVGEVNEEVKSTGEVKHRGCYVIQRLKECLGDNGSCCNGTQA